ncbi:hypothetical protein V8C44DRAFT_68679 [Trichoderma aethiopicum]
MYSPRMLKKLPFASFCPLFLSLSLLFVPSNPVICAATVSRHVLSHLFRLSPLSVAVSDSLHTACLGIFPTDWRGHDNASGTLPWTLHLTSFAARDSIHLRHVGALAVLVHFREHRCCGTTLPSSAPCPYLYTLRRCLPCLM